VFSVDLAISDEEQLNGEVINAYASIQHKTFAHLHFGLSYAYFDVGVDFKESGLVSSMNYKYQGPVVSIVAVF